jgi:hypothetical protein
VRFPSPEVVQAVLAGGVAGQRPGEGDLLLGAGPLDVNEGGVPAVGEVAAGIHARLFQPGVDAG